MDKMQELFESVYQESLVATPYLVQNVRKPDWELSHWCDVRKEHKGKKVWLAESIDDFDRSIRPMYRYAKRKHDDTKAVRRSTGLPYFTHPEAVAKLAMKFGGTETEVKVALAHDVLEDTGTPMSDIIEKFGDEVAGYVKELTNNTNEVTKMGKRAYIDEKLLHLSDTALFVKLCDMLHNSIDNPRQDQALRMLHNAVYLELHRDLDERCLKIIDSIYSALGRNI